MSLLDMLTKRCTRCGQTKPLEDFHKAPRYSQGRFSRCKVCHSLLRSRNYHSPEALRKRRERQRKSYESNPEPQKLRARATYKKRGYVRMRRSPEKERAQGIYRRALKSGKLVRPASCSDCGKQVRVDGHHTDYSRPLEVIWLCRACHLRRHRKP